MRIEFEGQVVPADLLAALSAAQTRPWLIRAAVCHPALAVDVERICAATLHDPTASNLNVGASIQAAHALMLRTASTPIALGILADRWQDMADPTQPGHSLMHSALACLVDIARPDVEIVRRAIQHCLSQPDLRAHAWRATQPGDIEAILPILLPLLTEAPELAEQVATRLALLHPDRCLEAAQRLASLEMTTRRSFADALEKHLKRVFSVRRWIECRRALFGA